LADEAPRRSIAVLVRSNKAIARLIRLLRDRGLRASGEGGNPLIDSEAVLLALSLLHLADHPSDSAARFHVATSSLGSRVGLPVDADAPAAGRLAARVRAELLALGYGPWLAALQPWVDAAPQFEAWDRRRFAQLVDLGYAWDARAGLRPGDFVTMVREH